MITYPCPACGHTITAENQHAGRAASCPMCAAEAPIPEKEGPGVTIDDLTAEEAYARRTTRSRAVLRFLGSLLVLGGILWWLAEFFVWVQTFPQARLVAAVIAASGWALIFEGRRGTKGPSA